MISKREKRIKRHNRIRKVIVGTKERPRFCIFKSNKHIYAILVDDKKNKILLSVSDRDLKLKKKENKTSIAKKVGELIAQKAKEIKIENVVFDRGGFLYHGRVKALAEGAREGGLKF